MLVLEGLGNDEAKFSYNMIENLVPLAEIDGTKTIIGGINMDKFENIIKNLFGKLIGKYNLYEISISENEIYLVGTGFALSICVNNEGTDVFYINPKSKTELEVQYITNLLQDRFTANDRLQYGEPLTNEERIFAELKVLASGLENQWGDLLIGNKSWLKKYTDGGSKPNIATYNILAPIFEKQKLTN